MTDAVSNPSFAEALPTWAKIGFVSFGGPAGQIALMHKILVDEKRWIDEQRFLTGLNFCMLLPGPEAMQLATYVGWRLHGIAGGLAAGLLFVLPGAALILALALAYAQYGQLDVAETVFLGVKAAVLAIVVEALLKVAKRALKGPFDWALAAAAFVAIFAFAVPFPLVVIAAGLVGYVRGTSAPAPPALSLEPIRVPWQSTATTIALWLAIWLLPLVAIGAWAGPGHVLTECAWLFSKLAVVTFGGAYAVLTYLAQEIVQTYGWLTTGEMLDALGLAETTPGPLILVIEFVAVVAAWRHGGEPQFGMALLGGFVALWATFAPCFLWVFAGAPYVERLHSMPRLKAALAGITAAVVGVIMNLTIWFALHVLFRSVGKWSFGPLQMELPDLLSLDPRAAVLSVLAFALLFGFNRGILQTLAMTALAAVAWQFIVPR
ncbi:MAG: chromate efflux transporter [Hyphomicrobium sp.]|nr:chromate efflux transporter [Hyphomicrobium sp.]